MKYSIFLMLILSGIYKSTDNSEIFQKNDWQTQKHIKIEKDKNIAPKGNVTSVDYQIDTTVYDEQFLKIFQECNEATNTTKLFAQWGKNEDYYKIELSEANGIYTRGHLGESLKLITMNTFLLIDGCGTNCLYALIFNVYDSRPKQISIDYYYEHFKTDDKELIIYDEIFDDMSRDLIVYDIETEKMAKVRMDKSWSRGMGRLDHIIDELIIRDGKIYIVQIHEGQRREISKILTFK